MGSRGMEIKMTSGAAFILLAVVAALASAKPQNRQIEDYDDDLTLGFDCPEPNGLFADPEQCDLYYECNRGVATAKLCKDGYLFDDSIIGPQGIEQTHPVLPHPTSCRHFFTCYFEKDPNKLGCPEGQVFDTVSQQCKEAEQVPECACWYECLEDSNCPGKGECN